MLNKYVYFIGTKKQVKIGVSVDTDRRLREIQTGHHEKLRLIARCKGSFGHEAMLHDRYKDCRLTGEWFSLDSRIEKEIPYFQRFDSVELALACIPKESRKQNHFHNHPPAYDAGLRYRAVLMDYVMDILDGGDIDKNDRDGVGIFIREWYAIAPYDKPKTAERALREHPVITVRRAKEILSRTHGKYAICRPEASAEQMSC